MEQNQTTAGLTAASKLEEKFENTKKRIDEVKTALKLSPAINITKGNIHSTDQPLNVSNNLSGKKAQVVVDFSQILDDDEVTPLYKQSHGKEPVYQRLIDFGAALKMRQELQRRKAGDSNESFTPTITKVAKNLKREGRVEDHLMKLSSEYKAKIEELRREKLKEEMKSFRDPKINKSSQNIQRPQSAFDRLYSARKEELARKEEIRNSLKKEEMKDFTGKPKINSVSKALHRSIDSMLKWDDQRKQKRQKLKSSLDQKELASLKNPKINIKSKQIAKHLRKGKKVEDYLLEAHEKKLEQLEKMKREEEERLKFLASPCISVHSVGLQRDEPIFDRLYRNHLEILDRREELKRNAELELKKKLNPQTKKKHRPYINPRSAALKREVPIEEILLRKGEEIKQRQQQKILEAQREIEESRKKMSKKSEYYVKELEKRTNISTRERLTSEIGKLKGTTKQLVDAKEAEYSFKPTINEKSRQIDRLLRSKES